MRVNLWVDTAWSRRQKEPKWRDLIQPYEDPVSMLEVIVDPVGAQKKPDGERDCQ